MKIGKNDTFQRIFDIIKPKIESKQNIELSSSISGETTIEGSLNKINNNIKDFDIQFTTPGARYWKKINWNVKPNHGKNIWTDGNNIYYSNNNNQYILNKNTMIWEAKIWSGVLQNFYGKNVWTDGKNIYYSNAYWEDEEIFYDDHYILHKDSSTWEMIEMNGSYHTLIGEFIWTDGDNIYYSNNDSRRGSVEIVNAQYVLDKNTLTWSNKTWNGRTDLYRPSIWTDSNNIYYSGGSSGNQYILDKNTSTWNTKTWDTSYEDISNISGSAIWSDGNNIYHSADRNSYYSGQYILDKNNNRWLEVLWAVEGQIRGDSSYNFKGEYIWTDGDNFYYSNEANNHQYIFTTVNTH